MRYVARLTLPEGVEAPAISKQAFSLRPESLTHWAQEVLDRAPQDSFVKIFHLVEQEVALFTKGLALAA